MNNSYKNAMDKIVLSDEEKEKLIKTALLKTKSRKRPVYKYAANIAAGVIICLVSIPVTGIFLHPEPDYVPIITATPNPAETPQASAPPAPTAQTPQSTVQPKPESTKAPSVKPKSENTPQQKTAQVQSTPVPKEEAPAEKDSDTSAEKKAAEDTVQANSVQAFKNVDNSLEYASGGGSSDGAAFAARSVSPYQSYETTDELLSAVSFIPTIPKISGYSIEEAGVLFGTTVQIIYTNGSSQITYRTCEGNEDCSGDYSNYKNVRNTVCGGRAVTLKTDDAFGTLIVWSSGTMSYSLHSDAVLTDSEAEDIISGM